MDKIVITAEYDAEKSTYEICLGTLQSDTKNFFEIQHPSTDIFDVYGRVKALSSILLKLERNKKTNLSDIDDIIGITVVCHCRSDAERAMVVLGDYLPTKYLNVKYAEKDSEGYKAHHFNFNIRLNNKNIACEIQIKTVLQNAWGIQSHQYLYKKSKEANADILARTMSGIFENCENLWELVKKSTNESADEVDIRPIAENVAKQVAELEKTQPPEYVITGSFAERAVSLLKANSSTADADLEEILESEIKKIKNQWLQSHQQTSTIEDAKTLLGKTESSIKDLTVLGLYAIKYERPGFLKQILSTFSEIANISQNTSGLIVSISIPAAVLHNIYYYFGAYAIAKKKTDILDLLINFKMEIVTSDSTYYLVHIWSNARIIAPEIVHGADQMFDRLRRDYVNEDERIRSLIESDYEKFTDLIIQFNFLFTIRGEQLLEQRSTTHIWNYPNFGRFYGFRVSLLLNRMLKHADYSDFVKSIFKIDVIGLKEKLPGWLASLMKKGGQTYWWESIQNIE